MPVIGTPKLLHERKHFCKQQIATTIQGFGSKSLLPEIADNILKPVEQNVNNTYENESGLESGLSDGIVLQNFSDDHMDQLKHAEPKINIARANITEDVEEIDTTMQNRCKNTIVIDVTYPDIFCWSKDKDIDATRLKKAFLLLGFKVCVHSDFTTAALQETIKACESVGNRYQTTTIGEYIYSPPKEKTMRNRSYYTSRLQCDLSFPITLNNTKHIKWSKGKDKETKTLKMAFLQLGFQVGRNPDLTKAALQELIQACTNEYQKGHAGVVFVFSSHEGKGNILTVCFYSDKGTSYTKINDCKTKPKIFIFKDAATKPGDYKRLKRTTPV